MSVIYVSSLQTGKECLRLIQRDIAIDHVVTIDRQMAERANVSGYVDFGDVDIPVHHLTRYSMKSQSDVDAISALAPRLIIVNGWNRLIPAAILDLPEHGCVGFHGSWKPLPFGRGRSPITWAILNDADRFFLHLLQLDAGVDSGDVIDTEQFDIGPSDTSSDVLGKVGITSAHLLIRNVPRILDGTASRTPQTGTPTYLPKRSPEGGLIDWTMSLREICRLIRAVSRPYPGAFTDIEHRGTRVRMRIWDAVPFSPGVELDGRAGSVVHEVDGKLLINCRDGILMVKDFSLAPPSGP